MVVIRLYGILEAAAQRSVQLHASTFEDAMRGLFANFPKLRKMIHDMRISVLVNGEMVTMEDFLRPMDVERIDIMPVVGGAGPAIFIIAGAALMAGAETLAGLAAESFLAAALTTSAIASFGLSLIIGGIAQLLIKPPKQSITADKNDASYLFNGPVNVTQQGNPVPIGYGRLRVGSVVVSSNIQTWDIPVGAAVAPAPPPAPPTDPDGPFLTPFINTQ